MRILRIHPDIKKDSRAGYNVQVRRWLFFWETIKWFRTREEAMEYVGKSCMIDPFMLRQIYDIDRSVMQWKFKKEE